MPDHVALRRFHADTRAFLERLSQNNTRAWFAAHKQLYDTQLKRPAEKLLGEMAAHLEKNAGPVKTKLFRPHRDIRFSKDKTPYHTHLHLMWSLPDGRAWMFGLAPGYATAGAGIMTFTPPQLERWRGFVDSAAGAGFVQRVEAAGWRLPEPDLKRVPAPHAQDHPRAAHLRRKSFVVWADDLDDGLTAAPLDCLQQVFDGFAPVIAGLGPVAGGEAAQ